MSSVGLPSVRALSQVVFIKCVCVGCVCACSLQSNHPPAQELLAASDSSPACPLTPRGRHECWHCAGSPSAICGAISRGIYPCRPPCTNPTLPGSRGHSSLPVCCQGNGGNSGDNRWQWVRGFIQGWHVSRDSRDGKLCVGMERQAMKTAAHQGYETFDLYNDFSNQQFSNLFIHCNHEITKSHKLLIMLKKKKSTELELGRIESLWSGWSISFQMRTEQV